jgi:hypothetical protein
VSEPAEPYATLERNGVRVHIPTAGGQEISFVCNLQNAHALIVSVTKKAAELATTQGKLQAGADLLSWLLK